MGTRGAVTRPPRMMVAWSIVTRRAVPGATFNAEYKLAVLAEYDAAPEGGREGIILRREGLVLRARDRVPPGP